MNAKNNITSALRNTGFFLSLKEVEDLLELMMPDYNKEDIIINIIDKDILLRMFYDKYYSNILNKFIDTWRTSLNVEWTLFNTITRTNRVFILAPEDQYFLDGFFYNPSIIQTHYTDDSKSFITMGCKTMKTDIIPRGLLLNKEEFGKSLMRIHEYKKEVNLDNINTMAKSDCYFIFLLYYAVLAFLEHDAKSGHKRVSFDKYINFSNKVVSDRFGEGKAIMSSQSMLELSFPVRRYQESVKECNIQ